MKTTTEIFNRLDTQKQTKILSAITTEFGSYGYDKASIRNISKNLGISIGSLYQYFNHKQGMLAACVEYIYSVLEICTINIVKQPLTLPQRITSWLDSIEELGIKHPEIIAFYNKIPTDKLLYFEWRKQFDEHESFFRTYLETVNALQAQRHLDQKIDPIVYTFIIDSLMLSSELSRNMQYQKIKSNVFLQEDAENFDLLKQQIIQFLNTIR